MKKVITIVVFTWITTGLFAQWKPAGDKIKTLWAEKVDPNNVLPEYPRPMMERSVWKNLNGLWEYAILPVNEKEPSKFDGKILVPFAVESSLSGVQERVSKDQELWYKRTFTVPIAWKGKNILLHFGAVDWKTEVFINDVKVGVHVGGFTPFYFNITPFLKGNGEQKLVVKVYDATEHGFQSRGKQITNPSGICYTPVSGIWQTVWMEPVEDKYISNIKTVSDIDKKKLTIYITGDKMTNGDILEVRILD